MYCEKCGKQINDGADFCPFCGVQVSALDLTKRDETLTMNEETIPLTNQNVDGSAVMIGSQNVKADTDNNANKWEILEKPENEGLKNKILKDIRKLKRDNVVSVCIGVAVSLWVLWFNIPLGLVFISWDLFPFFLAREDINEIEKSLDRERILKLKNHSYWNLNFGNADIAKKMLKEIDSL